MTFVRASELYDPSTGTLYAFPFERDPLQEASDEEVRAAIEAVTGP